MNTKCQRTLSMHPYPPLSSPPRPSPTTTSAVGCKTIRVLHCVRAMANVSQNMKAKMMLAKETRLIPVLVDAMRSGCDEAERVQHYGAQVIDAYIH